MLRLVYILLYSLLLTACAIGVENVVKENNDTTNNLSANVPTEFVISEPKVPMELVWSTQLNEVLEGQNFHLDLLAIDATIYIAEPQGRVAAYHMETGKLLWELLIQEVISGGIGAGRELLLIGTESAEVIAIDREKGRIRWRATVSSEVLTAPQIEKNVVIAHVGDGKIVALDATDGKRIWTNSHHVPSLSLRGNSTPIIWMDKVITGFANGQIAALELRTGKTLWETTLAVSKGRSELERMVDIDAALVRVDNVVYTVGYQGKLSAVDLDNGQILWARDLSSHRDMAIAGGQIYVTDSNSRIWALDRGNGATLWRQDKLQGRFLTAPMILQADYLIVGDYQGLIHCLARADGSLLASQDLEEANNLAQLAGTVAGPEEKLVDDFTEVVGINVTPLAVGNILYVTDKAGVLAAYRIGAQKADPQKKIM